MNSYQNFLALDSSQSGNLVLRLSTPTTSFDAPLSCQSFESQLIPTVDTLLSKADLSIKQIDAFVLGKGPGSFMGLRLGFSVFRTWAWIDNKPITIISSLDLLVKSFQKTQDFSNDSIFVSCIDGKMKKVFTNIQDLNSHYLNDSDITPQDLVKHLQNISNNKKIFVIGSGALLIKELISNDNIAFYPEFQTTPESFDRSFLQSIDESQFSTKSKNFLEPIEPLYLRLSAAEESLKRASLP